MLVDRKLETDLSKYSLEGKDIPEGVMVFRIFGVLMFGAAGQTRGDSRRDGGGPRKSPFCVCAQCSLWTLPPSEYLKTSTKSSARAG